MRGRFPLGQDDMGGVSADVVTNAAADSLGGTEGEEEHTLTDAEMPSHNHSVTYYNNGGGSGGVLNGEGQSVGQASTNTSTTGSDDPHNNMPPYITLNYIIKL